MKCVDHVMETLTLHNNRGSHVFDDHMQDAVRQLSSHLNLTISLQPYFTETNY